MLEYPEVQTIVKQLRETFCTTGHTDTKKIIAVLPPAKPHKFCWFAGDPAEYNEKLLHTHVCGAEGSGIFADILFANGLHLSINDGVCARFYNNVAEAPANYQLQILFADNTALVFTVAMYGGLILHDGSYDNEYYLKSRAAPDPFSSAFEELYLKNLAECKDSLSAKAFLATDQHFPGIGNGCIQDILFNAGINPRRKLSSLNTKDKDRLLSVMKQTLQAMTEGGGRSTEKDLFGDVGGYNVLMSKNALSAGCPHCGSPVTKETFLGGSVYYCPHCQPQQ